ncbi:AAA family ATPase [Microbulbifer sp.]|uniref:AAA family ATPase n=1 Tax=Microbulbifer sp. TaxID=1908541 RepID=UPI00258D505C|nr:AAA family ATPase [Microbulbifer sp.]
MSEVEEYQWQPSPADVEELREQQQASPPLFAHVSEFLSEPEPVAWTIQKILERATVAQIFGLSTHGKSFMAIDWVCCVATGTPWHGCEVQPGPVFYICGEGHAGLRRRFKAWEIEHKADLSVAPIHVSRQAVILNEMSSASTVVKAMDELSPNGPPALVVVDTMHRNFKGDENSSEAIGDFLRTLEHFRNIWSCAVVVVHHTGHGDQDRARGSSALRPAFDWDYRVSRSDDVVTLTCQKAKDHATPEPMYFRMEQVELPWVDEKGDLQSGAVLRLTDGPAAVPSTSGLGKQQQHGLDVLKRLYSEHEGHLESGGLPTDRARVLLEDWKRACNLKDRKQFYKLKEGLLSRKLIRLEEPYVHLL